METINGRPAVRTSLPCPECRAAGITEPDGLTRRVLIVQSTPESLFCDVHGKVTPAGDGWSSADWRTRTVRNNRS